MSKVISNFIRDEAGASAIEYALIAALVSIAGIASMATAGTEVAAMFGTVATELTTATAP